MILHETEHILPVFKCSLIKDGSKVEMMVRSVFSHGENLMICVFKIAVIIINISYILPVYKRGG